MKKALLSASLVAALLSPTLINAQDRDRDRDRGEHHDQDRRYYDRRHKDYHNWDSNEDRAYHMYWEQHRRSYIEWERANERQRQAYWDWRHQHSDAVLRINIH